jgi:GT2 family glycosyltransferase
VLVAATAPRASIILLSFARPAMLAESLRAAVAQRFDAPFEIIVVDNESGASGEIEALVATHAAAGGAIRHVRTGENCGFAGGMNRGLREARGALVLMTEDDMVLEPDALAQFARAHERHETPALFSGVIRDRDSGRIWYAGGDLSLDSVLRLELSHRGATDFEAPDDYPTGYLTGALVFAPASLLRELGGYREDYFMYSEDVELCLRARRRDVGLHVVRDALAWHFTPSAASQSPVVEYHKIKNLLSTCLLHSPAASLPMALARYAVADTLRAAIRRRGLGLRLRALAWLAWNTPRLLRDRWRMARGD